MTIKQIYVSNKQYNGNTIENIYGLSEDDNLIYVWAWKTGEWKVNKKEEE